MKINGLNKQKHGYLIHTWSDKALKDNVVNLSLSYLDGGSLEITRTIRLTPLTPPTFYRN